MQLKKITSRGWLINFIKRFALSLRRKITTIPKDPENLIDKIVSYAIQVRQVSSKFPYGLANMVAMDETAPWSDMVVVVKH